MKFVHHPASWPIGRPAGVRLADLAFGLMLCGLCFLDARGARNVFYVVVLPMLWQAIRDGHHRLVLRSPILQIGGLFVGYAFASQFWSETLSVTQAFNVTRTSLFTLAFLFVASYVARRPPVWRGILIAALAAAVLSSLVSLAHYVQAGLWPARFTGLGMLQHEIRGPVILASLYLLPLGRVLLRPVRTSCDAAALAGFVVAGVVLAAVFLLAQSRGPLLAAAVTAILLPAVTGWRVVGIMLLTAAAAAAGLVVTGAVELPAIFDRFLAAPSYRLDIWRMSLDYIGDHLLFGLGYLSPLNFPLTKTSAVGYPHSIYVTQLVYGGLVGLSLLLALYALGLRAGMAAVRRDRDAGPLLVLVFGAVAGLTNFDRIVSNLSAEWIFFWLPLAMLAAAELRRAVPAEWRAIAPARDQAAGDAGSTGQA